VTEIANKNEWLALAHTDRSTYQRANEVRDLGGGTHKFTQLMRARVLREELQHRLQHLAELLDDVTRAPDDPEQLEVVAIASAVDHLRAAVDAIEHATEV
jgi:ABC-type hemin transport system ATPase subunit